MLFYGIRKGDENTWQLEGETVFLDHNLKGKYSLYTTILGKNGSYQLVYYDKINTETRHSFSIDKILSRLD